MPSKLLKPRPMTVVEPCVICGREHTDEHDYRHCAKCGRAFCWLGEAGRTSIFGVERRSCGSRRDLSTDVDRPESFMPATLPPESRQGHGQALRRRVEYRCRACVTRSWIAFGADWAAIRPLAVYVFLSVAFSLTFWALLFWLVTALLRRFGIG